MIVVTGALGFIGSNLVRALYDKGYKDVLMVDYEPRNYNSDTRYMYTPADCFYQDIEKFKDIEVIFHEGAISSTTETDWKKLKDRNIGCTWKLIYYCRDNGIPLQYASSASVYGNPTIDEWHNPNKKLDPLNLYAKSKHQIDFVAEKVIDSKRPPKLLQGLRYFNVYGPNEDHKEGQSSPYHTFRKQLERTGKIKLFEGSKEFRRDFVPVEEVVRQKLWHFENSPSGIYDVGTGKPKSFFDVAIEVGGSPDVIEWIPMPDNLKEHYQKYSCALLS